jgi:zinc transport system ATP-binding protein
VNLAIHAREMIGIIGPNGGGKTTLLRLILGLLKPRRGKVLVFGQPPARSSHRLGYVPQHMLYDNRFPVSVLDVVLMGLTGKSSLGPFARATVRKAEESLASVNLSEFRNSPFAELSGGQRQRCLSPARWHPRRTCSCSTSPRPTSIPPPAKNSTRSWSSSMRG